MVQEIVASRRRASGRAAVLHRCARGLVVIDGPDVDGAQWRNRGSGDGNGRSAVAEWKSAIHRRPLTPHRN